MRFKTFLERGPDELDYTVPPLVYRNIKRDCAPFLAASGDRPLYRGLDIAPSALLIPHPKDREPADSDESFNFFFNAMMELGTGIPEGRRSTLFTSPDRRQASSFGHAHYCFPAGPINVMWSSSVEDSMDDFHILLKAFGDVASDPTASPSPGLPKISAVTNHMFRALDRVTTPPAWLKDGARDLIEARADLDAISIMFGTANPGEIYRTAKKALHHVFDTVYHYGGTEVLIKALEDGNEIFVTSSNGYYMVPVGTDSYETILQKIHNA